jgi:hypothetical protein
MTFKPNKYNFYLKTGHGRFANHYDLSFLKPFYSIEIKMFWNLTLISLIYDKSWQGIQNSEFSTK